MNRDVHAQRPAAPGQRFQRIQRAFFGVDQADYAAGFHDFRRAINAILRGVDDPRERFAWRIFLVAWLGFLTDSYNLFASNVVLPALSYVYWNTPDKNREYGFNVATLVGSIIGQIGFGVAVDWYGRRALYGFELLIVVISTVGLLQCSQGFRDPDGNPTWSITVWLFCWRFIMGVGVGAEYPLSACIAAEWSSKVSRARMMGAVFSAQPFGQLLAYVVGYGTITRLTSSRVDIDKFWRIVIGVGTIPTLAALVARRFLRETWRFTFFVTKSPKLAQTEAERVYPARAAVMQQQEMADLAAANAFPNNGAVDHRIAANGHANGNAINGNQQDGIPADDAVQRPVPAWQPGEQFRNGQFWTFLGENRMRLAGTSICWFLLDIAFYGMGFNSPGTLAKLWTSQDLTFPRDSPWWQYNSDVANITAADGTVLVLNGLNVPGGGIADQSIDEILKSTMLHAIYTTSIAAIAGSLLFIGLAHRLNRRLMLIWTFFAVSVVLAVIAGILRQFFHDGTHGVRPLPYAHIGLICFWALAQFLFNFGPNTLTFILPAEVFPTRYRCTCYGISAAIGKLGAIVAQSIVWGLANNDVNSVTNLQWLMVTFSICMAVGGGVALIPGAIPDVQEGEAGFRNKGLEDLTDDGDLLRVEGDRR